MSSRKNVIRVGDRVRIIDPRVCVRAGYPRSVDSYLPQARELFEVELGKHMAEREVKRALREICYGLARKDHFGGTRRDLILEDQPHLKDSEFVVTEVHTVQTGDYYSPSWTGPSWEEPYGDYEPGGLTNRVTRRLCSGFGWRTVTKNWQDGTLKIPSEHLLKLES